MSKVSGWHNYNDEAGWIVRQSLLEKLLSHAERSFKKLPAEDFKSDLKIAVSTTEFQLLQAAIVGFLERVYCDPDKHQILANAQVICKFLAKLEFDSVIARLKNAEPTAMF